MFPKIHLLILILLTVPQCVPAQDAGPIRIHSHNDYLQKVPFWNAIAAGAHSIEVDIFLRNDTLYATHDERDIKASHTLSSLYLEPLRQTMVLNLGAWQALQLLVDIKSEPTATLKKLLSVLSQYPDIIHSKAIHITISGNRPPVAEYVDFPEYILFDYQSLKPIKDAKILAKIGLISLNFSHSSQWNGKGRLTATDQFLVKKVIDSAHALGKPFRFWATPDSKTAWKALHNLGVDYINTDTPHEASHYLKTLGNRSYRNVLHSEVLIPSYASDQKWIPVKNIILLLGDGNGLTQISSSVLANGGALTLTQFKSIGFLKTQSADDFTTDSAAAATALSTGVKTNNRAIGVDTLGRAVPNIMEVLSAQGFGTGIVTTDRITGATPAAFYAHQKDRSDLDGIAMDLLKSKLSLFVGGGAATFDQIPLKNAFEVVATPNDLASISEQRAGLFLAPGDVPGVLANRGNILAEATGHGLTFLNAQTRPFFLVVEGAQIDSNGHYNNVAGIVTEGIDFDRAITEAVKFADKTGNTLVIVTADHETSGFSIPQGDLATKMIEGDFTTDDHTGTMVPIFAYGPYSQEFQGIYENNEVFAKILKVLGLAGKQ